MALSTLQIENHKNFEQELSLIERLNSLDRFVIRLNDFEQFQTKLTKTGSDFKLEINEQIRDLGNEANPAVFVLDNLDYELKRLDYFLSGTKIDLNSGEFSSTYKIKTLQSKGFTNNGSFKTFYPVDLDEIKSFHAEFETVTYQSNTMDYFYDCLRVTIDDLTYDVTQFKTNSQGYYVFECLDKQSFDDYMEVCYALRQAIGFINRLMVGDEEYTFDNCGKLYYSNHIRPAVKGMYSPIVTNPYSYLDIERNVADHFYSQLTRITSENLSKLTSKIHSNVDFSTAIMVILEVTSVRSLLLIPSSFAVIIELLSKALSIEETGLEVPIADNELKNRIVEELHDVIEQNGNSLSEEVKLKLKRRLSEINKPINRQHLTNNEKLTRPFEQLGIRLSLHDIAIIEHRNDLLHGNILLRKDEDQSTDSINTYMAYVSAKLYTLISKLILKSVGYNGYVYNQAKYIEKYLDSATYEEHFERI